MASVFDVADYIISRCPSAQSDWTKLQKLVYYAQAWSLAWDNRPLFEERIEAWKNGPVTRALYRRQRHEVGKRGDPGRLVPEALMTIDAVVDAFGKKPGAWLSELAHRERPWIEARQGLPPEARSDNEISLETMRSWYKPQAAGQKVLSPEYIRGLEILVETPIEDIADLTGGETVPGDSVLKWLEGSGDLEGDEWGV